MHKTVILDRGEKKTKNEDVVHGQRIFYTILHDSFWELKLKKMYIFEFDISNKFASC